MVVELSPELDSLIEAQLQTGRYRDKSDVLRDALQLVAERNRWIADVQAKVAEGAIQLAEGRVVDVDEFFDELEAEFEEEIREEAEAAKPTLIAR